jgi:hypothetical protein
MGKYASKRSKSTAGGAWQHPLRSAYLPDSWAQWSTPQTPRPPLHPHPLHSTPLLDSLYAWRMSERTHGMTQPTPQEQPPAPRVPASPREHTSGAPRPARSKNGCNACRCVPRIVLPPINAYLVPDGEKCDATNNARDAPIASG